MNDVVERVARAIYESHGFVKGWDHADTFKGWHAICRDEARAAIEAMRPATLEMLIAGSDIAGRSTISRARLQIAWSAMLSAALADASPDIGKEG